MFVSQFIWNDFALRTIVKATGEHEIKWEGKTFLDLDYSDDLSVLDKDISKISEFSEVVKVEAARKGLKFNIKKIKSLTKGIDKGQKVIKALRKMCIFLTFWDCNERKVGLDMTHFVDEE